MLKIIIIFSGIYISNDNDFEFWRFLILMSFLLIGIEIMRGYKR